MEHGHLVSENRSMVSELLDFYHAAAESMEDTGWVKQNVRCESSTEFWTTATRGWYITRRWTGRRQLRCWTLTEICIGNSGS